MTDKKNHISRRSFLSQVGYGMGTMSLISATSPFSTLITPDTKNSKTAKKLLASTDYIDNILINDHFLDKTQLN